LLIIGASSFSLLYWSYHNYRNINDSIKSLAEPNNRTNKVNRVFQEIIEADNLFNTFILTNDSATLSSYNQKLDFVESKLENLKSDFNNDTVQLQSLDSLGKIVEMKTEYLKIILKLKKEQSSAFFTSEALKRIGRQLQDSAFIEKALLKKERLVASTDSVEKLEIIKTPDDFSGISGFFRKLFGKPNIEIDSVNTIEEQIDYSLELSIDTSIVRDYFVDTTLIAVKQILMDVLTEEINLQYQLNDAELKLYEQDQKLIDKVKVIVGEILEQERANNSRKSAKVLKETRQGTRQIFISGGVGILLSAIFLVLLFQDITKANQLRKNLQLQKEKALNLAKAKEDFLAKMSHEIRTPLHNIMGFTNLLSKQGLSDSQQEYLVAIVQSNHYLSELINNILEKSKIDADNFKVEKSAVNISLVANEIQQVFRYKFLEKSLQFELSVDDRLSQYKVYVDGLKLKQVLINLIGNAVKFTEKGSVKLAFEVKADSKDQQQLHIFVEDTGQGISDEDKEKVFLQFEQGEHGKASSLSGSGLGLTISKNIIEAFGGEIKVEDTSKKGTRFHLWFPVLFGAKLLEEELLPQTKNAESDLIKYDIELLVVEDDPWNAKLMEDVIGAKVRSFKVCHSAEEALTYLQTEAHAVDFIMTDISLPEMDGIQFFQSVRELGIKVPVIAITAHVLKSKEEELQSKGFTDIIIKPFKPSDILEMLDKYFHQEKRQLVGDSPNFQSLWEFSGGNEAQFEGLVKDFYDSLEKKLIAFEESIHNQDYKTLATLAHQMKSAFEQIKIQLFSESFQSIEVYVDLKKEDRALEEAEELLPKLVEIIKNRK